MPKSTVIKNQGWWATQNTVTFDLKGSEIVKENETIPSSRLWPQSARSLECRSPASWDCVRILLGGEAADRASRWRRSRGTGCRNWFQGWNVELEKHIKNVAKYETYWINHLHHTDDWSAHKHAVSLVAVLGSPMPMDFYKFKFRNGFSYRASKFFRILGTGLSWLWVNSIRSTGHVGLSRSHSEMHPLQNACSQTGAWTGFSRTPEQMGQRSSSSTVPPTKRFTSRLISRLVRFVSNFEN